MEKFYNKDNVLITSIVETVSNFVTNHASNCTVIHGSIYYISKSKQLYYYLLITVLLNVTQVVLSIRKMEVARSQQGTLKTLIIMLSLLRK